MEDEEFARNVASYIKNAHPWWDRLSKEEVATEAVRIIFNDEALARMAADILASKRR